MMSTLIIRLFMNRMIPFLLAVALSTAACFHPVFAFDFRDLLKPVSLMRYDHHHIKKNKITGYTKIKIKTTIKNGKSVFLEIAQNLDRNQTAFSEKQTLYDAETGDLISYTEVDHRTDTHITDRISNGTILTHVRSKGKSLDISVEKGKGIVPFEVLPYYLRQSLAELQKKGSLVFTLYIPVMAIELKRKGMPVSFSKIEMETRIVETETVKTVLGTKPAIRIMLKPTSFLLNAFLPKDRTSFYFTFAAQPPHTLLSFRENQTESVLTALQP